METQSLQLVPVANDYHANVDTSRPFRSVKEAVAILGERILLGEFCSSPSPKPPQLPCYTNQETDTSSPGNIYMISPSPSGGGDHVFDSLKKLESELEETKVELKLLKERETETEVALATLNAELHKNMSKLAQAEATVAAKAAAGSAHLATGSSSSSSRTDDHHVRGLMRSDAEEAERNAKKEQWMIKMEDCTSMAQILSFGAEYEKRYGYYGGGRKKEKNNKTMKKKPIVPLLHDLFSRKKGSSAPLHNRNYSSTQIHE